MFRGIPPLLVVIAFFVTTGVFYLALNVIPSLKKNEAARLKKSLILASISVIVMLIFFFIISAVG